jgi:hypothetical protein
MAYSLSQIRAWDVDHLTQAADHWAGTADRWDSALAEAHQQAHAVAWEGAGATAMRDRVTADKAHVTNKAEQLREAASVARQGASDISAAQRKIMYAVEDAQKRGFKVDEDLSVFDTRNCPSVSQRAARRAQAQALAAEISQRAGELSVLDNEVATNITAVAGDVDKMPFASAHRGSSDGHIQLVDNVHKCTDDQDDVTRKIASAVIGGAMIGGAGGAITGPGALPGALVGGASAGILAAIDEATSGGERFSGCE